MTSMPNVLFIITDQQRADHVGFMGNATLSTPNLDRIAAQGVVFDNAWVSNPVCMPNRSSILTGRMPTAHGVIFNDRSLEPGVNTFARRLAGAGYRTGLIGKSHLQHGMSKNSVVPFRGESAIDLKYPSGWDQLEDFARYLDVLPPPLEDFYGFNHVEFAIDHGARATGHHLQWALKAGASRSDMFVEYAEDAPASRRSEHWWQIYQPPYAERFHSTRFVAERSCAFISQAVKDRKSWLAYCSFPDPHHPMTPPGRWFDRHAPEDMLLPETRHDRLADAPAHLRAFQQLHPREQRDWVTPCGFGSDELLGEAIAATYGMVEMIDDGVGEILRHLDELGVADNTIVVFTSDHGDMMGDHGLFLKGFMHYRGTLQVPMVISGPGIIPSRTTSLASSIDLGPTILDLCQVAGYDGIQGRSLTPLLKQVQQSVRDWVLIEDDIADVTAKLTPIPGKTRTIVTPRYRYTRNSKGEEQLFDLAADPEEMDDIKRKAGAVRTELIEVLADALIATDDAARGAPATQ